MLGEGRPSNKSFVDQPPPSSYSFAPAATGLLASRGYPTEEGQRPPSWARPRTVQHDLHYPAPEQPAEPHLAYKEPCRLHTSREWARMVQHTPLVRPTRDPREVQSPGQALLIAGLGYRDAMDEPPVERPRSPRLDPHYLPSEFHFRPELLPAHHDRFARLPNGHLPGEDPPACPALDPTYAGLWEAEAEAAYTEALQDRASRVQRAVEPEPEPSRTWLTDEEAAMVARRRALEEESRATRLRAEQDAAARRRLAEGGLYELRDRQEARVESERRQAEQEAERIRRQAEQEEVARLVARRQAEQEELARQQALDEAAASRREREASEARQREMTAQREQQAAAARKKAAEEEANRRASEAAAAKRAAEMEARQRARAEAEAEVRRRETEDEAVAQRKADQQAEARRQAREEVRAEVRQRQESDAAEEAASAKWKPERLEAVIAEAEALFKACSRGDKEVCEVLRLRRGLTSNTTLRALVGSEPGWKQFYESLAENRPEWIKRGEDQRLHITKQMVVQHFIRCYRDMDQPTGQGASASTSSKDEISIEVKRPTPKSKTPKSKEDFDRNYDMDAAIAKSFSLEPSPRSPQGKTSPRSPQGKPSVNPKSEPKTKPEPKSRGGTPRSTFGTPKGRPPTREGSFDMDGAIAKSFGAEALRPLSPKSMARAQEAPPRSRSPKGNRVTRRPPSPRSRDD